MPAEEAYAKREQPDLKAKGSRRKAQVRTFSGRAGGQGKQERRKEGNSEATCKLWVVLLLLLLPTPPERGSPVQGPGEKAKGYS